MATKTDITLPPLPRYMDSGTAEEFDRRVLAWGRAAVEADRQHRGEPSSLAEVWRINADEAEAYRQSDRADTLRECAAEVERLAAPQPAEPVKVPSDEEAAQFADAHGVYYDQDATIAGNHARALLSRYGQTAQPAASAEPVESAALLDALSGLVNVLRERHHGRMPDEVQAAYDKAWAIVFSSPVAAPVAQEPVAEVLSSRKGNDTSTIDKALPAGTKLYVGPIAAQAQPQQSENQEALADTQRAIIEAAERRGYARAEAENVGYRTDAGRYRFIRTGDAAVWCSSGDDLLTGDQLDAAIDAARVAKGADHG